MPFIPLGGTPHPARVEEEDDFDKACEEFDKSLASNSVNNPLLLVGIDGHESNDPSDYIDASGHDDGTLEEEEETGIPNESRISKALSEQIQKIVVLICLILLFILPLTQIETYISPYLYHENGLNIAVDEYNKGENWESYRMAIDILIDGTNYESYYPLIWLSVADPSSEADHFNTNMVDLYPNQGEMITDLKQLRSDAYFSVLKETDNN